jgi:hypothetical protein
LTAGLLAAGSAALLGGAAGDGGLVGRHFSLAGESRA